MRSGVDYGTNDVEEDERTIRYRGGGFRGREEDGIKDRVRFRDESGREIGNRDIPSARFSPAAQIDPVSGRRKNSYDDEISRRSYSDRRPDPYLRG